MDIISIDAGNIEREHICCAIGNDKTNQQRALSKKEWMKKRFTEGLVFKRLNDRGKVFIEYMPVENGWKPVTGKNFMLINCLWVSGKFKGNGLSTKLLDECIKDAKSQNMDGVAVVSSNKVKPFLTDRKFFIKHGFETVDSAPPYFELLALKFNENAQNPQFNDNAKKATYPDKDGFAFVYSNQCPFMEEYVNLLAGILKDKKIPFEIKKLESREDAQKFGSPFGTLGIY